MEAANFSPTPPDKIFAIALGVVAIFGAVEIAGVAVYYINRARAEYVAAHPKAPAAAIEAPKATAAPVEEVAPAPAAVQSPPSAAVLSVAERRHHQRSGPPSGCGPTRSKERERSRRDGDDLRIDPALRTIE
jgi:hypothetical protein